MPLYDIQCVKCENKKEIYCSKYPDDNGIENHITVYCEECDKLTGHEILPSLCSMHPDNMWSGVMTDQGYVTSKSTLKAIEKEKGIEKITSKSELDNLKKKAATIQADQQIQRDEKRKEYVAEKLKGIDIDNTGVYDTPL